MPIYVRTKSQLVPHVSEQSQQIVVGYRAKKGNMLQDQSKSLLEKREKRREEKIKRGQQRLPTTAQRPSQQLQQPAWTR